ncbi:GntR family transcriptional regulator [Streptomyces malaysiensis]|uniref:GntR family transcriptional regulator n=1 Tax=Streptomyces malaysiensis TaxID=92644 RepID=A0A7X5X434_STRMQ|nr:GntR family transcriptional regulator [Streptomyces malaysiensis]NIY65515.1 GntR family transcriptional regulator [Streptomyces malaysiensis]
MTTTSATIATVLAQQLADGALTPHELSRIDLLARRFQVSPPVVRTARKRLEDQGLVARTPSGYSLSPAPDCPTANKTDRVEQFILTQINEGRYKPGDLVPTGAELARRLDVSLSTAGDALRRLKDHGVLHGGPGKAGTRVAGAGQKPPRTTAERASQVAAAIRKQIQDGKYPPGTLLPSNHKLAQEHQVPEHVIVHVIKVLAADGVVETLGSVGKLVRDPKGTTGDRQLLSKSEQFIAALRDDILNRTWSPGDLLPSSVKLAQRYGLGQTTVVKSLPKLRAEGLLENAETDTAAADTRDASSPGRYRITAPDTWPDAARTRDTRQQDPP